MLLQIVIGLLAMSAGVVFIVWGYRAFLILLPIAGFVAGFILGAEFVASVLNEGFLASVTGWIAGAVLGTILALLSYFIYSFGIAILAAVVGLGLGAGIVTALGIESSLIRALVPVAGAVLGLGLAIFLDVKKYLIVVLTSLGGAAAWVAGLLLVLDQYGLEDIRSGGDVVQELASGSIIWILIWIGLTALGIFAQAQLTRGYMNDNELGYIGRPKDIQKK